MLTREFQNVLSIPMDEMKLLSTVNLDEIIKNVKEGISQQAESTQARCEKLVERQTKEQSQSVILYNVVLHA